MDLLLHPDDQLAVGIDQGLLRSKIGNAAASFIYLGFPKELPTENTRFLSGNHALEEEQYVKPEL